MSAFGGGYVFCGYAKNIYFCCMSKYKQQSHVVWKCDYHIVWCPRYRFCILTGVVKDMVEHDIRIKYVEKIQQRELSNRVRLLKYT